MQKKRVMEKKRRLLSQALGLKESNGVTGCVQGAGVAQSV
jgi:hypothetical protein